MSEQETTPESDLEVSEAPKRKRGRPRKNPLPDPVATVAEDLDKDQIKPPSETPAKAAETLPFEEIDLDSLIPPSKEEIVSESLPEPPKRKRGRPRKNSLPEPEPQPDPDIQKNLDLIANMPTGAFWAIGFEICRKRWLQNASALTAQEIASLEKATNDLIAYYAPNLKIAWPVASFCIIAGTVFAGKYMEHKAVTEAKQEAKKEPPK